MSGFSAHVRNHFSGCRLIATGHDACRGRDTKFFAVPGEFEHVGYYDGNESFVCPVITSMHGPQLRQQLDVIRSGGQPGVVEIAGQMRAGAARRSRVAVADPQLELPLQAKRGRVAVIESPIKKARNAVQA